MKSGFVGVVGRPNVGKSTLINAIVGHKVSIVTPKPQTTRDNIKGIYTKDDVHIVFTDTPGIHEASKALNRRMVKEAIAAMNDCDLVLMVTDVSEDQSNIQKDQMVIDLIKKTNVPKILAINKIDLIPKPQLLPQIEAYDKLNLFEEIVPISALNLDGLDELVNTIAKYLPEGPMYYPPEMITDRPLEFVIAEVLREKAIMALHQELPYSLGVKVTQIEEKGKDLLVIHATIVVERDGQKSIVIGKNGQMLKKIGMEARRELEWMLNKRIYLDLFVKVIRDWTKTDRGLQRVLDE